jgi:MFS family permease
MDTILGGHWTAADIVHPKPLAARRAVRLLFFANGALFATWASRVPALQVQLGLNNGRLGLALLAMSAGAVIAMPTAGWLCARHGSEKVCRFAALAYCALLPALALAPDLSLLSLTLFWFGVCHGGLDVAMNAQAVAVEKQYRRRIMSSFHALWSTGGLVGAAAGGLLAGHGLKPFTHFTLAALLLAGVSLLAFPDLLGFRSEAGWPVSGRRGAMFRLPGRGLVVLGAIAWCIMLGEGAMADWSAVYLRSTVGTSESGAAAGYAAFSIAMAGGRFFGDYLSTRFGSVILVRAGAVLAASGLSLALLTPSTGMALAGFACVGLGFATIVPMVFSAAGCRPGFAPGIAVASVTTLGYLGFLLGPPMIGFMAELLSLRFALGIIVATSFLAAILARSTASGKG